MAWLSVQITKVFQGVSEDRDTRKGICGRIFNPRSINNTKFKLGKFNSPTVYFVVLNFWFFNVIKNKANAFLICYNFEMPAK